MDFSDLYSKYARDVHRFATWLSGDPVLAEDLTAEEFKLLVSGKAIPCFEIRYSLQ